jgi:hypothetical protein
VGGGRGVVGAMGPWEWGWGGGGLDKSSEKGGQGVLGRWRHSSGPLIGVNRLNVLNCVCVWRGGRGTNKMFYTFKHFFNHDLEKNTELLVTQCLW